MTDALEVPVVPNKAEIEFEESIKKILDTCDLSNENGIKLTSKRLNEFLKKINKLNIARDLVAHVFVKDNQPMVDIFCRNTRMDELALKLIELHKNAEANKAEIVKTEAYIQTIRSIGLFI